MKTVQNGGQWRLTKFLNFILYFIYIFISLHFVYYDILYRVVVSVSTSRSRDGLETYFSNISVSGKCGMVLVSSQTENQMSRSGLGSRA